MFNSPLILSFALISLVPLIISFIPGGASNRLLFTTYHSSLLNPLTYLRFFTHNLGHSGWTHYITNMAYLLLLGPALEVKYGWKRILLLMAATALITGLINYIFFRNTALCGASGIVFTFITLTSMTGFKEGELPLTVILVAVIFIGQQIYEGIFVKDNVSNLSHIIGGVIGSAFGYLINKKQM